MYHRNRHNELGLAQRIAIENQLLNEEKWIIDTLKKIHAQRNSLQIEKLHLESLKSRIVCSRLTEGHKTPPNEESQDIPTVNLMQQLPNRTNVFDSPAAGDEVCNEEELQLTVTNPMFQTSTYVDTEEEDDMTDDDLTIDMNMFMNGQDNTN